MKTLQKGLAVLLSYSLPLAAGTGSVAYASQTDQSVSDRGKHNGLFWSETADEFDSTLGPLIAHAGLENTKSAVDDDPIPFNGYYFRVLAAQGQNAPGGAKSYIVDSETLSGFAFAAYPAECSSSGVMTFIVDENALVYETDLGPNTTQIAEGMTEYDPNSTWHEVD
jgi:Protein of unknown function (DUF2950)